MVFIKKNKSISTEKANLFENVNRSMKLKPHSDFVDCEIIHKIVTGNYDTNSGSFIPVVAFTSDSENDIINRIKVYKGYLKIMSALKPRYVSQIEKWTQGKIVICKNDLSLSVVHDVNLIQGFFDQC
jgi:hypothetical protein